MPFPLFGWLFKPSRQKIAHERAEDFNLESIANDTDFTRSGSGLTVIAGNVGHGVKLSIQDSSRVLIRGTIGSGCSILKEGGGTLTIEGTVADDLKLIVWGQGSVTFTRRPPQSVIGAIKNRGGVAQIICAGEVLPQPRQEYIHHNLGAAVRLPVEPEQRAMALAQPLREQRPVPAAHHLDVAVDQYSDLTRVYIETSRAHNIKTIAARINELNLSEEEQPSFEVFQDPILMVYFNDIPVAYNEIYYNLSTLLDLYNREKPDPYTREPLKLANFQPARKLFTDLDKAINNLKLQREAAKKEAVEAPAEEQQFRL